LKAKQTTSTPAAIAAGDLGGAAGAAALFLDMNELYFVMNMGFDSVYAAGAGRNTWPMGPLHGTKVIDMTSVLMGPWAAPSPGGQGGRRGE
jgi:hypothetical protein